MLINTIHKTILNDSKHDNWNYTCDRQHKNTRNLS